MTSKRGTETKFVIYSGGKIFLKNKSILAQILSFSTRDQSEN
jgi:hypothetical protein